MGEGVIAFLEQVDGLESLFIRRVENRIHSIYNEDGDRLPLGGLLESPASKKSSLGTFTYKGELITQKDLIRDLKEYNSGGANKCTTKK